MNNFDPLLFIGFLENPIIFLGLGKLTVIFYGFEALQHFRFFGNRRYSSGVKLVICLGLGPSYSVSLHIILLVEVHDDGIGPVIEPKL